MKRYRKTKALAFTLALLTVWGTSMPVHAWGAESRPTDRLITTPSGTDKLDTASLESVTVTLDDSGFRMLMWDSFSEFAADSEGVRSALERYASRFTPNVTTHLSTTPAGGVRSILIKAENLGVVVERSETGSFELDLVGAADPAQIQASVTLGGDGVLTLDAKALKNLEYISTAPNERINSVLLRVPPYACTAIKLQADTALLLLPDLGVPVDGTLTRGCIRVSDREVSSAFGLSTGNGSLIIAGDRISGAVDMTAENGSVQLEGGRISGNVTLTAANGSTSIKADSLSQANLQTNKGSIQLDVGTLTGNVGADTRNGSIQANLRQMPTDLTLDYTIANNGSASLPDGWTGKDVFGSGKPTLKMSCRNGASTLTIGATSTAEKSSPINLGKQS